MSDDGEGEVLWLGRGRGSAQGVLEEVRWICSSSVPEGMGARDDGCWIRDGPTPGGRDDALRGGVESDGDGGVMVFCLRIFAPGNPSPNPFPTSPTNPLDLSVTTKIDFLEIPSPSSDPWSSSASSNGFRSRRSISPACSESWKPIGPPLQ
ncbi:hypothetical protein MRB53_003765 [Persea americana]|uniref:Uncharacterized protein n=1 Tax=Persea americana TaxID=3435 RepID=A0ACC2MY52_PERAE|nr:hypothetical protein MRB53_003765 [Persea americana]